QLGGVHSPVYGHQGMATEFITVDAGPERSDLKYVIESLNNSIFTLALVHSQGDFISTDTIRMDLLKRRMFVGYEDAFFKSKFGWYSYQTGGSPAFGPLFGFDMVPLGFNFLHDVYYNYVSEIFSDVLIDDFIKLDLCSQTFGPDGISTVLNVETSNISWSANSPQDWISLQSQTFERNHALVYNLSPLPPNDSIRIGQIIISSSAVDAKVFTIIQRRNFTPFPEIGDTLFLKSSNGNFISHDGSTSSNVTASSATLIPACYFIIVDDGDGDIETIGLQSSNQQYLSAEKNFGSIMRLRPGFNGNDRERFWIEENIYGQILLKSVRHNAYVKLLNNQSLSATSFDLGDSILFNYIISEPGPFPYPCPNDIPCVTDELVDGQCECNGSPPTLFENTFTADQSSNWNTDQNWSRAQVPEPCDQVLIPLNKVVILNNGEVGACFELTLEDAARIELKDGAILNIQKEN
ncbi:MAG: BACON domain-containing protein, partial [Bacteroidota bacterium]